MAERQNKGENNVEKLDQYLNDLMDLKQQVETKGMNNDLQTQLKLILRVVWGTNGYYTKKYCNRMEEIKPGRTLGYTIVNLSGKMTSFYPKTFNSPYSQLLNDIEKSLKKKISKILSTHNTTE